MSRWPAKQYDKELLKAYLEEGKSNTEIAHLFECAPGTVAKWRRNLGYEPYTAKSKYDYERLLGFIKERKSINEIAQICNVKYDTVHRWIKNAGLNELYMANKIESPPKRFQEDIGFNADRHLCKTCRFRNKKGSGCDYYYITDNLRNCPPEMCNKYEKE